MDSQVPIGRQAVTTPLTILCLALGRKSTESEPPPTSRHATRLQHPDRRNTLNRLTRNNAVLLLVDHQISLYIGVRDIDVLQLKHNVVGLMRAMLALKSAVVVTTTTEKCGGLLWTEPRE